MPTTSLFFDITTVLVYLLVIFVPGTLTGLALGLRGWTLAAIAPLMTYAIGGLAGPWYSVIGLPFNVASFIFATALTIVIAFLLRQWTLRRLRRLRHRTQGAGSVVSAGSAGSAETTPRDQLPHVADRLWARSGHFAVLACVLIAAAAGAYTMLDGIGGLDSISQGFDAVYHANGIRYVAESQDGGLFATSTPNWYGETGGIFYPNAYHLIGAVAYQLTGASIPAILNTGVILLPGLFGLSLVAVVREFRARAVLAGAVPFVLVASTVTLYEFIRGPLWPYALGVALLPLSAVCVHRYLRRPGADTFFVLAMAAAGLLSIHSSTLFGGVLFALPLLIQRWFASAERESVRWRGIGKDILALLPVAVIGVLITGPHLLGAISIANSEYPYNGWPSDYRFDSAVGTLLAFQHDAVYPQLWIAGALLLGFVFLRRLNGLRWIGGTALLTGAFFVAVATSNAPLVMALTRPWWDDPYRILQLASVPLCLIAAHGLAETQAFLRDRLSSLFSITPNKGAYKAGAFALAAAVLAVFAFGSGRLYETNNAALMAKSYGKDPGFDQHVLPVTPDEVVAMTELGKRAKPGEWAMNDRGDGTAWTYAISGVRTVAGHFDDSTEPKDASYLAAHFREYPTNPEVKSAVQRLNVRWVIVGQHGYPVDAKRQPGLVDLDSLPFLQLAYRNADASVYRLIPAA